MIIAVDFDGTLVKHRYPDIGAEIPGAFDALKKFKSLGATLILFTMRDDGDKNGPTLTQAIEFCRARGVEFDYVNENPKQKIWTASPKVYANAYIDDAAVGCPLMVAAGERPWADWRFIEPRMLSLISDELHAKQQAQATSEPTGSSESQGKQVATGRHDQAEAGGTPSLPEALKEIEHWKAIAVHLADCHAATAYDIGALKKTSKAQRKRLQAICAHSIQFLKGEDSVPRMTDVDRVIRRCQAAIADLKEA